MPLLTLIVGGLLLIAGATAYLVGRDNPPVTIPRSLGPQTAGLPYPEVERIALAETKARYDSGTALILDVRITESYERAHIPNAVSIPLSVLATRHQELDKAEEILIYCT